MTTTTTTTAITTTATKKNRDGLANKICTFLGEKLKSEEQNSTDDVEFSRSRGSFRFIDFDLGLFCFSLCCALFCSIDHFLVGSFFSFGVVVHFAKDHKSVFVILVSISVSNKRIEIVRGRVPPIRSVRRKFAFSKVHFYMITLVTKFRLVYVRAIIIYVKWIGWVHLNFCGSTKLTLSLSFFLVMLPKANHSTTATCHFMELAHKMQSASKISVSLSHTLEFSFSHECKLLFEHRSAWIHEMQRAKAEIMHLLLCWKLWKENKLLVSF